MLLRTDNAVTLSCETVEPDGPDEYEGEGMTSRESTYDLEDASRLARDVRKATETQPSGRTPLYAACNSARYQRQDLIRSIEHDSGYNLITYVSAGDCRISHDDVMQFRDLLHRIADGENTELMLHTPGGDIDAAEKLILMIRDKIGEAGFRIVVPHLAKSAGTLMVLGADTVVMSDTSELGPIDPQVRLPVSGDKVMWLPAQSYLDAYTEHSERLRVEPNDNAARIMIGKLDPIIRRLCITILARSRTLAESLLNQGMFYGGSGNTTLTAGELIDIGRWGTHSQVISWRAAQNPPLGLHVDYLAPDNQLWQKYWQLYCLQRLALRDNEKLFESNYVSLPIEC